MIDQMTITERDRTRCLWAARRILKNPADAEDAVQTAFMKAWRRRREFRGECSVSSFLSKCTRMQCLEFLRNRSTHDARLVSEFPEDHPVMAHDAGIERSLVARDTVRRLARSVGRHRHYRLIFDLMFEGYRPIEIAQLLHMNESSVKVIVFRIRSFARASRP